MLDEGLPPPVEQEKKYPLREMIDCVAREIFIRKNIYKHRTSLKHMRPETAEHEIKMMENVLQFLKDHA